MTDILKQLRDADDDWDRTAPLYEDAANEIEQLRAALEQLIDNVETGSYESTGQCIIKCRLLLEGGK